MTNPIVVDELASALKAHAKLSQQPQAPKQGKIPEAKKGSASEWRHRVEQSPESWSMDEYKRWHLLDEMKIDYGYLSKTGGAGVEQASDSFYITTAINYTNGPAHMGHAYEAATTDVIARYQRLLGDKAVYFVTGSDEHGQKIANKAADVGKEPIDICNQYVMGFQVLNQRILISNDDYVRTTSERHKRTARELWKRCHANGDIYLDTYSGWYNIREETFVTDSEAADSDYKDRTSGAPLKQVEEESYFFKMSAYKDKLIKHIEDNPDFIQPEQHRKMILKRLQSDGLRDLSISRTTFSWGIRVPEGFSEDHVMYVWVDALSNYLTGVNGLGIPEDGDSLARFWPANVHIIGKDILWFHTVIWPCLLMSAEVPLPKAVFAHGFVSDKEGEKMSKTVGNVVDPHDILDKFDVDTFRWYLCKEAPYGGELSFSEDSMRDMHNDNLCHKIGNLVHRTTILCGRYCSGVVPDVPGPSKPPVNMSEVIDSYTRNMTSFGLHSGANVALQGFRDLNGFLKDEEPWLLEGDEHTEARQITVRATLEAIYALAHLLLPFLPQGASKIFKKLNTEPVALGALCRECRNLKVGTKIEVGDVLYAESLTEEEPKYAKTAVSNRKETLAEAKKRKREEKAKNIAASKKGQVVGGDPNQPQFTKIDIRVGKIVKVWDHEEASKFFCLQVDVGEESGPREIASSLRDHYSLEDMQDRKVLVVCNLKPRNLAGFVSSGMVLAAKALDNGSKVELIEPPADALVGERVFIKGLSGESLSSAQVKNKTWEAVAKSLQTGDDGVATWEGKVIETTAGPCKVSSLVNAPIS